MKPKQESKRIKELKHKSRRLSIKEGVYATIKTSLGDTYISAFAIAINSTNFLIALISAITGLVGPISQWVSSRLIEKYPRKKIVTTAVLYECLMWIPLIITAILFNRGILTSFLPFSLLLFFSLYVIIANIASPAWFSWVGDLVDDEYRGKWFSKRNFIHGVFALIFTISGALFMDFLKKMNYEIFGFIILFFLAMSARLISRYYFTISYEPKLKLEKNYYFSFWEFVKKAPSNNFGRFAIFRSAIGFAMAIGAPFFAVYMLRSLNFNYITFISVTLAQTLFGLFIIKWWGKFADRFGNYQVIKITSILISIFPALWLISDSPIYLILVPELLAGLGWAGFTLAAGNFIYDSVSPQRRGICVSYYNVLHGIGVFLGAGVGAILVKYLTISFMDKILFIILISSLVRLIVSLTMLPYIREIKKTEKFNSKKVLESLFPRKLKISGLEGTQDLAVRKRYNWKK